MDKQMRDLSSTFFSLYTIKPPHNCYSRSLSPHQPGNQQNPHQKPRNPNVANERVTEFLFKPLTFSPGYIATGGHFHKRNTREVSSAHKSRNGGHSSGQKQPRLKKQKQIKKKRKSFLDENGGGCGTTIYILRTTKWRQRELYFHCHSQNRRFY